MARNSTCYSIAATDSFRLGSRKILGKWGTNLQNIDKENRKLYIPDEGKILVQVDQAGAEALIVAYLCIPGNYRDLFLNGIKSHVFVGLHVFLEQWKKYFRDSGASNIPNFDELITLSITDLKRHIDWKEVDRIIRLSDGWPASSRYYYIAKMICHASNYGMRASAFQLNVLEKSKGKINLTKKQAEFYLTTYHTLFPEIHEWHREIERQLKETQTLFNLFGYPREFFYPMSHPDEYILKKAYAFIPQSTVGCITHIAYTNMYNFIVRERKNWDLLGNCHDSYLLQCPIGEEKELASKATEFMEQSLISPRGERFNMKAEAQAGYNWSPRIEIENKDGTKTIINPEGLDKL